MRELLEVVKEILTRRTTWPFASGSDPRRRVVVLVTIVIPVAAVVKIL
jgi:hypothetical protein